jgi:hypothetical protein
VTIGALSLSCAWCIGCGHPSSLEILTISGSRWDGDPLDLVRPIAKPPIRKTGLHHQGLWRQPRDERAELNVPWADFSPDLWGIGIQNILDRARSSTGSREA